MIRFTLFVVMTVSFLTADTLTQSTSATPNNFESGKYDEQQLMGGDVVNPGDTHIILYAHVQNQGWIGPFIGGQVAGTVGQSLRLEAVKIFVPGHKVCYQAHVQNIGWQPSVCDGAIAGTTGQSLRMEALRVWMDSGHVIYYGHVQGTGWTGPARDGAVIGTTGQSLRLEAVSIRFTDSGQLSLPKYGGDVQAQAGGDTTCHLNGSQKVVDGTVWIGDPFYELYGPHLGGQSITIKTSGQNTAPTYDDGSLRVEFTRQTAQPNLTIFKWADHIEYRSSMNVPSVFNCGGGEHLWFKISLHGQLRP